MVFTRRHPAVRPHIFVDDLIVSDEGPPAQVRRRLGDAAADMFQLVPEQLKGTIAEEKIALMASTEALAQQIRRDMGLPRDVVDR